MSPEALTADRVYRDLKRQIMSGRFVPGLSIGLAAVAQEVGTSISPVRDALHRLVGERLVEPHGGGGFATPEMTSETLQQLYRWHADLIRLAVRTMTRPEMIGRFPGFETSKGGGDDAIAALTATFFARVGASSDNAEHRAAIISAGERLHTARLQEGRFFGTAAELEALWNVTGEGNKNTIRVAMWHYHRRRLLKAEEICVVAAARVDSANKR